jgi:hypothetical protein
MRLLCNQRVIVLCGTIVALALVLFPEWMFVVGTNLAVKRDHL